MLLFGLLAAIGANAAPHTLGKRHSHCFSYNLQGCQYSDQGFNGAVATVGTLLPEQYTADKQEVGTCSEVGVDILAQGGNAADGKLKP